MNTEDFDSEAYESDSAGSTSVDSVSCSYLDLPHIVWSKAMEHMHPTDLLSAAACSEYFYQKALMKPPLVKAIEIGGDRSSLSIHYYERGYQHPRDAELKFSLVAGDQEERSGQTLIRTVDKVTLSIEIAHFLFALRSDFIHISGDVNVAPEREFGFYKTRKMRPRVYFSYLNPKNSAIQEWLEFIDPTCIKIKSKGTVEAVTFIAQNSNVSALEVCFDSNPRDSLARMVGSWEFAYLLIRLRSESRYVQRFFVETANKWISETEAHYWRVANYDWHFKLNGGEMFRALGEAFPTDVVHLGEDGTFVYVTRKLKGTSLVRYIVFDTIGQSICASICSEANWTKLNEDLLNAHTPSQRSRLFGVPANGL